MMEPLLIDKMPAEGEISLEEVKERFLLTNYRKKEKV